MRQEVLNKCKQLLKKRKEELQNEHVSKKNALYEEAGELASTFDNHPADMGTELFERERDMTINQQEQDELLEIEHALEAIESGTYPMCEKCGRTINEERLLAVPTTRYCIDHAK